MKSHVGQVTKNLPEIIDVIAYARRWWLREFLSLFPARFAEWLTDQGGRRLVLIPGQDTISLQLTNDRGAVLAALAISTSSYTPSQIDAFLISQGLQRHNVSLGVRLASPAFFCRELVLPRQALSAIGAVLDQELIRKTPFKLEDIYHDHTCHRSGDQLQVRHWVVRRRFIADALDKLGLDIEEAAFAEAATAEKGDASVPLVRLSPRRAQNGNWTGRAILMLTLSALLLAAVAGFLKYQHQQALLNQLSSGINATKAKAQHVREMQAKAELNQNSIILLRTRKREQPPLTGVWEEVSALLPPTSWLTELRLSESPEGKMQITMTGFSNTAADLVAAIDKSALFEKVTLTAPITVDSIEQKERFVIQANVGKQEATGQAAK